MFFVLFLQPGEQCQQSSYILDVIEEEPENDVEKEDDDGDFSEDSESGEEEFTPSKWNSDLTPSHSLLKSPQNRSVSHYLPSVFAGICENIFQSCL